MDELIPVLYDPDKTYVLIIPRWEAVIPKDWTLETQVQGEYQPSAGKTILLEEGDRLRGDDPVRMQRLIDHQYIREVTSDADSI